ncbi:MAG: hypothetical protein OXE46_15160 [Chloroflexi bacterium]|nr:hypothetical protein [Chloroflexota bacterium]
MKARLLLVVLLLLALQVVASAQVFTDEKLEIYNMFYYRADAYSECDLLRDQCESSVFKGDISVLVNLNYFDFRGRRAINVHGQEADYDPNMHNRSLSAVRHLQSGTADNSHPMAWPEPPTHLRLSWTQMDYWDTGKPKWPGKNASPRGARGTMIIQSQESIAFGGFSFTIPVKKKKDHHLYMRVRAFYADGSKGPWLYAALYGKVSVDSHKTDDCLTAWLTNGSDCLDRVYPWPSSMASTE